LGVSWLRIHKRSCENDNGRSDSAINGTVSESAVGRSFCPDDETSVLTSLA